MKVVTAQEMREIDRTTIEYFGIPGAVLMERAGLAVASRVRELLSCSDYPTKSAGKSMGSPENFSVRNFQGGRRVLVLCGGGNNGGDGLVAARSLFNWGFTVNVLMFARKGGLSPDCDAQYRIAKKLGIPLEFRKTITGRDLHGSVVLDAVFGTGLSRPVEKETAGAFSALNKSEAPVISADIPSGISSDTGEVLGDAVRADCTVTFGLPKRGHFLYPGADYTGRLFVEDIGFPPHLLASENLATSLVTSETVWGLLPPRPKNSYKGDFGHILVVAGSRGKTGAAMMTARSCLKSGAGLVTLAVPDSLMDVFQGRVVEEMTLPLPDDGTGMMSSNAAEAILEFSSKKADVIAIGPGIGVSADTKEIMLELVRKATVPLVIDADGLNSIGAKDILKKAKAPLVLTPHPGEMARLLGQGAGIREIEKNRIDTARQFSKETGTYLVLKGAPTTTADPEGNVFINTGGNPGMATAGSGDVLTGIIAGLLGQGLDPATASFLGVYLHGIAGDCAARELGEQCMVASDIIRFLPGAFGAHRDPI